jgi:hypothetical protein
MIKTVFKVACLELSTHLPQETSHPEPALPAREYTNSPHDKKLNRRCASASPVSFILIPKEGDSHDQTAF